MSKEDENMGNTEHISSIKEKLQQVSDEINTLKLSFSKSTEDLSRIQSMLDVGGMGDITGIIEKYENQKRIRYTLHYFSFPFTWTFWYFYVHSGA